MPLIGYSRNDWPKRASRRFALITTERATRSARMRTTTVSRNGCQALALPWIPCVIRAAPRSIALFGVRLGGTLAAVAAAERGDVQSLLLWAPCRTGRSYLRELRVLRAGHSRPGRSPQAASADEPGGPLEYEEAAGFVFQQATIHALNRLDLSSLSRQPASQALLISRDDLPNDERLAAHLAALGTTLTQAAWPGYAAMMRDAQDTEVPQSAIGSMIHWLDSQVEPAKQAAFLSAPSATAETCVLAAETYLEEPVLWGTQLPAFGILTRPYVNCRRGRTVILLLNVGANHHIGPNRMYVELARQLAAQGFPVFRLDVPGMGDSARDVASARGQIYSASSVQHIHETISYLETRLDAEHFVLIGLCSGAYMAYQVASHNPRVSTQILINPQTFDWKEGDSLEVLTRANFKPTHVYLTGLNDADVWKRLLHRQINVGGIAETLWKRLMTRGGDALKSLLSLLLRQKPFETPVRQTFRRIADRGTDTLFIFAAEDVGIEVTAQNLGTNPEKLFRRNNTRKSRGMKNLRIEMVEEADHTFTQKAARETMLTLIVQHLDQRYPSGEMALDDEGCHSDRACSLSSPHYSCRLIPHPAGDSRSGAASDC